MALLHIYDSTDPRIIDTVNARGATNLLPISDANNLISQIDQLVEAGRVFDRILFETHGSPGSIRFGETRFNGKSWLTVRGRYSRLTAPHSRIYFNGCNVAEGTLGWDFLTSAAAAFLGFGGGVVFGQTSLGFGNPFNGHVVHLWGSTRKVYVDSHGQITQRVESE